MIKHIIKNLVGNASTILDEVITTDEERAEAKRKLKQLLLNHQAEIEKNITDRWKADMISDSWLSKNIRPLTLAFLITSTVLLIFIDAGFIDFIVKNSWVDLLQLVLISVVGAYFGGRSIEKIKNK